MFLDPDIFYSHGAADPMRIKNIRVQKNAFLDMEKIGPGQLSYQLLVPLLSTKFSGNSATAPIASPKFQLTCAQQQQRLQLLCARRGCSWSTAARHHTTAAPPDTASALSTRAQAMQ